MPVKRRTIDQDFRKSGFAAFIERTDVPLSELSDLIYPIGIDDLIGMLRLGVWFALQIARDLHPAAPVFFCRVYT